MKWCLTFPNLHPARRKLQKEYFILNLKIFTKKRGHHDSKKILMMKRACEILGFDFKDMTLKWDELCFSFLIVFQDKRRTL